MWTPSTPKRDQYINWSRKVLSTVFADWNQYYPFSWLLEQYPITNPTFTPVNEEIAEGYYKVEHIPYKLIDFDIID